MLAPPFSSLRNILILILLAALVLYQSASLSQHKHRRKHHTTSGKNNAKKQKQEAITKLNEIKGTMGEVKHQIKETKVQEGVMLESMEAVQTRMDLTKVKLNEVSDKIETLDALHEKVLIRLEKTQQRLELRKGLLGTRLKDNYQRNQETYIQTLFDSKSLHQMLTRSYYIRLIVNSDAKLIDSINKDVQQIKSDKAILEKQEAEQHTLETRLEQEKSEYASDLTKKRAILNGIQATRVQAESELDDLASEANSMNDRIRVLSELLRRQQAAARREAAASAKRKPGTRYIPQTTVWNGSFARPCDGPVTSGFGSRFHPILHRTRMHAGVDFGAGFGASIRAAAGGVAIMSGYSRGYGNCIIVDHGGGVTTLYGHCSARLVHEGQTVKQGETIGRVGATGMATGPHLHFEVRRNGVPVPPL